MRALILAVVALFAAAGGAFAQSAHDFRFDGLMGGDIQLSDYRGKAVLVVNTASECGFTPQLEGLQRLHAARSKQGLVVLGVPSNDFGGQEPLAGAQIARFCELNYGVTFPLAAKSVVKGPQAHPFYRWARTAFGAAGEPQWNFHKLLLDRQGRPVAAFPSRVAPDDPALAAAIDRALR